MSVIPTDIQRIDVGDAEIHVEITGDGPNLLLVAGLGGRGAFWNNQVQDFAKDFQVITFDHRGCGNSTPDKVVYGAEHMAHDVLALMDAMDIRQASLVGHSTGGAIGQHIALDHPERLTKLVLSCSWAGPDTYLTELFRTRREILISCGPLAYLTMGTYLAMPSSHLQPQMTSARAFMEERLAAFPGLEVELSRINAVYTHDLRSRLHKIATPTLCIGSMDDQITPPGFTKEMGNLIEGAETHLLDRGGHFSPIVATEIYNKRVLEFLTQ
ncbi:alpha/beta fold hydrolase [Parasphingorhabdus cellanae]|uniref:Alpha/beta fold hydrolase n=1 Tax=Parasphingorhabdus cellanae TaxID=2806553 RepID=A0ABX7T8K6_9SPHN|nr:alpha/beta fold hydrolase [Parasphingorhabdus cellanae]QTD57431.1 alpha/beta fold hydrolase [Parasphingorhabdus cellanae]